MSGTDGCFIFSWDIENFKVFLNAEKGTLMSPAWKTETAKGSSRWVLEINIVGSGFWFRLFTLSGNGNYDQCKITLTSPNEEIPYETNKMYSKDFSTVTAAKDTANDMARGTSEHDNVTISCKMWGESMDNKEFRIRSVVYNVNFPWVIEDCSSASIKRNVFEIDSLLIFVALQNLIYYGTAQLMVRGTSKDGWLSFVDCKACITRDNTRAIPIKLRPASDLIHDWPRNFRCLEFKSICEERELQLEMETLFAIHMDHRDNPQPYSYEYAKDTLHTDNLCNAKGANGSGTVLDFSSTLQDDLLLLYRQGILTDATLNTNGQSFSAHRSILAARSQVFRAMFEKHNTTEGQSGVVDIDDVDSATVGRLLVFLYNDSIDDMQWNEASALYYAADKYNICTLKRRCTDILKAGLTVSNACEALSLADKHEDEQLMSCVVDFIRDHDEVVSSDEWRKLEESDLRLTSKIVLQLYLKLKGKK